MRNTRTGWFFRGLLALGMVVAIAPRATAFQTNEIYACGQTCNTTCTGGPSATCRVASNGKCVLNGNVSCPGTGTGSGSIQVTSATTLDLQGYDITCTEVSPSSCAYTGIEVVSSGGKVTNSGTNESVVSGRFDTIIDCGGNATTSVTNLTVKDGVYGITNCKTVTNNVVGPSSQSAFGANQGISSGGVSNTDSISNNFISGRVIAIAHQGSTNVTISGNVFDTYGSMLYAILLGGTGNVSANSSVFFGAGYGGSAQLFYDTGYSGTLTASSNLCDPSHPDCASCIAAGRCTPYTSPFPGN